jgi:hypothetical protein
MSSDRIIVDTIKVAQDLLLQNLPPAHNLTDAATVMRFRELARSRAIRSALDRSSDTLLSRAQPLATQKLAWIGHRQKIFRPPDIRKTCDFLGADASRSPNHWTLFPRLIVWK